MRTRLLDGLPELLYHSNNGLKCVCLTIPVGERLDISMVLGAAAVFILGLCVGSFLNVCIYRFPRGDSIISPRSHCPGCGRNLGLLELIPVLSFFWQKRKCRGCGSPISWRYPAVELLTAVLFLIAWVRFGLSWATVAAWVLTAILICETVIDIVHQIIPNQLVLIGALLGLPLIALQSVELLKYGIVACLAAGLFMAVIAVVSGGMGGGDVKLVALMGLYLGPRGVALALFMAFVTGGLWGAILVLSKKKDLKAAVPFGPFLALGGIVSLLAAQSILNWYIGLWN